MNERLTDAELDEITGRLQGWASRDEIEALVAEVREHRAAMMLIDGELARLRFAAHLLRSGEGLRPPAAKELADLIDRIADDLIDAPWEDDRD